MVPIPYHLGNKEMDLIVWLQMRNAYLNHWGLQSDLVHKDPIPLSLFVSPSGFMNAFKLMAHRRELSKRDGRMTVLMQQKRSLRNNIFIN